MIVGSFDGGAGLPTLILFLLLAMKYIDACLFLFPFCLIGVLNVASINAASLASVSGDISSHYFSSLPSTIFPESLISAFVSAITGGVFSFSYLASTSPMEVLF